MDAERLDGRIQLSGCYPKALCAFVEAALRASHRTRVALERQIVRAIGACARETVALDGVSDRIGKSLRVARSSRRQRLDNAMCEAAFRLDHRPGKGGGVATVDVDRIKTADRQVRP